MNNSAISARSHGLTDSQYGLLRAAEYRHEKVYGERLRSMVSEKKQDHPGPDAPYVLGS